MPRSPTAVSAQNSGPVRSPSDGVATTTKYYAPVVPAASTARVSAPIAPLAALLVGGAPLRRKATRPGKGRVGPKPPTTGSIGGTVTDAVEDLLDGVSVELDNENAGAVGSVLMTTTTGTAGTYQFTQVPAGSYAVYFDGANATGGSSSDGYSSQYYDGPTGSMVEPVAVAGGTSTTGVDAVLAALSPVTPPSPPSPPSPPPLAQSATQLSATLGSIADDTPDILTAAVTGADPTGEVRFVDSSNGSQLGDAPLVNGVATLLESGLAPGTRTIVATYLGDTANLASTATGISISVAPPLTTTATGEQENSRHDGDDAGDTISPTRLQQQWTVNKGVDSTSTMEAPLVAGGRAFAATLGSVDGPSELYAFDATTGAQEWAIPVGPRIVYGGYPRFSYYAPPITLELPGIAYDGGMVFVENSNDLLTAYSASTGSKIWSTSLVRSYSFPGSDPVAYDGVVYVNADADGLLFAISEATGQVMWTQPGGLGQGIPSVDDTGVYVDYACNNAHRYALDGTQQWETSFGCEGGGSATAPLADGQYYLRENVPPPSIDTQAVDALDGTKTTAFNYDWRTQPAVDAIHLYGVTGGVMQALTADGALPLWGFPGDGALASSPVVAGDGPLADSNVFVGSTSGTVYGVDSLTGNLTWIAPPVAGTTGTPALTAADGMLFVADGGSLTAYGDS